MKAFAEYAVHSHVVSPSGRRASVHRVAHDPDGRRSVACCQPDAVSPVNITLARSVPCCSKAHMPACLASPLWSGARGAAATTTSSGTRSAHVFLLVGFGSAATPVPVRTDSGGGARFSVPITVGSPAAGREDAQARGGGPPPATPHTRPSQLLRPQRLRQPQLYILLGTFPFLAPPRHRLTITTTPTLKAGVMTDQPIPRRIAPPFHIVST